MAKTCIQDSFCASKLLFALLLVMSGASAANAQYSAIDLRGNTLCAITTNGEAACSDRGPQWALPDDLPSVREIAAGQNSACAITENDNLRCWGPDGFGVTSPPTDGAPYRSVSTNLAHACAINKDSAIECWGLSSNDRLNAPAGAYQQVSVAQRQACALDVNGGVSCWGLNEFGSTEVPTDLPQAQKVQAGTSTSCALLMDGSVRCWGLDIAIPQGGPFVDFSASSGATLDGAFAGASVCGIDMNGFIDCQTTSLFNGLITFPDVDGLPSDGGHTDVTVGADGDGCYLNELGDIKCFGRILAQLPIPESSGEMVTTPTGLRAAIYSDSYIELIWDGPRTPSQVAGHEIQRNGETIEFTQNGSSYLVFDLAAGEPETFAVRRVSARGNTSDFSAPITITTGSGGSDSDTTPPAFAGYEPPARPFEPTGVEAFIYSQSTVEVIWNRVDNPLIGGYEIRRNNAFIRFVDGTSFIDEVPSSGVYSYDIIPVNPNDTAQLFGFSSISVALGGAAPGVCR